MTDPNMPDSEQLEQWLRKIKDRDPQLYDALSKRRADAAAGGQVAVEGVQLEGFIEEAPSAVGPEIVLETIVREGRPALFVQGGEITTRDTVVEEVAKPVVDRLLENVGTLNPLLTLVGRIDVRNHALGLDYVGTGWLIYEDVICTNRHVAELIARRGADSFQFATGRFGDPIYVSVAYGREFGGGAGTSVAVKEVLFIEPPGNGPDIAFLRVDLRSDGTSPKYLELAQVDPDPGHDVVVVGYPARAGPNLIPDQAWMERIFGGRYDVKRVAPGLTDDPSRGWSTHDCTTLGGNSGSAVLDMRTGEVVALHFAGLYMVENYSVPASTLRKKREGKPWPYRLETLGGDTQPPPPLPPLPRPTPLPQSTNVTLTLPLTISVSAGEVKVVPGAATSGSAAAAGSDPESAAAALAPMLHAEGVLAIRSGLVVEGGAVIDAPCIVVAAHPERLEQVRAAAPASFAGLPVQVRPASIDDQLGIGDSALATEAPRRIAYDDEARTGKSFSFEWVEEPMKLRCHVGPDRGFEELGAFLAATQSELVSSIYQVHADHVRAAVEVPLLGPQSPTMKLVMDPQSRDHGATPQGQFNRATTFDGWAGTGRFERIYVPEGNGGLVDNAYHIKVTVRDGSAIWLSSGNWTRTSQPKIAAADRMNPARVIAAGNREWHVIAESPTLAQRYKAHILQDFKRCGELGGTPEAAGEDIFVDVPVAALESIALEAPPSKVFEALEVDRKLRVKPLLTPDGKGDVYCTAVIEHIESAQDQLLFQNQYINVTRASAGLFSQLVDALAAAAKRVPDCRIILRSDGSGFWDNVAELRRRGVALEQIRRLANTHTKGIVVDGRQVLVGSHNWSGSGVTLNRDASLIIADREVAAYFAAVFEADWARARVLTEPQPESVAPLQGARVASAGAPPPGYVRIPLADYLEG
jgi:phosphatidylserine/phosphatidylglycerophosphate/cardiolipin synthase-like enzyme